MEKQKFANISTGIGEQFYNILKIFFEHQNNIPNYNIIIVFKDVNGEFPSTQYNISKSGGLTVEKVNISVYNEYAPKTNYFGTFFSELGDAYYYYKCNEIEMFVVFSIEKTEFKEVVKTLTKVYIETVLKPLSKMIGYSDISISQVRYILNVDFDEESIISKTLIEFFWVLYDLDIHLISLLSSQKYENAELNGKIFIPHRGTFRSEKDLTIKLLNKVKMSNNIRQIRKLMEIANGNLGLVVGKGREIIGYGASAKSYECQIEISGYLNWKIIFSTFQIIYSNGVFRITNKDNIVAVDIPNIFQLNDIQRQQLISVLQIAQQQKHGTLIVIGEPKIARKEAKRLCDYNRGIGIKPTNLYINSDAIHNITSIDGAIIMDVNCICYGIGIILDGKVVTMGNPARGARFNSAINYVENCKKNNESIVAVVISEDETVDFCY